MLTVAVNLGLFERHASILKYLWLLSQYSHARFKENNNIAKPVVHKTTGDTAVGMAWEF